MILCRDLPEMCSTATAKPVNINSYYIIIGETVQNQDKEWLTTGMYQAERATVFNTVQPTDKIVKISFPLGDIVTVVNLVRAIPGKYFMHYIHIISDY